MGNGSAIAVQVAEDLIQHGIHLLGVGKIRRGIGYGTGTGRLIAQLGHSGQKPGGHAQMQQPGVAEGDG